jgi:tRNA pseudouridine38-40 synthase
MLFIRLQQCLLHSTSFTSLCRPSDDFKTNICGVTEARWDAVKKMSVAGPVEDEFMRFTITSNRFLRGMVRKTVGTLLMVGSAARFQ